MVPVKMEGRLWYTGAVQFPLVSPKVLFAYQGSDAIRDGLIGPDLPGMKCSPALSKVFHLPYLVIFWGEGEDLWTSA